MNKKTMHSAAPPYALRYRLVDGFIHHWLAAGPQLLSPDESGQRMGSPGLPPTEHELQPPTSRPLHLSGFGEQDAGLRWDLLRCADDHFLHLSDFARPTPLRVWLYATLVQQTDGAITARLTAHGQVIIWLNGQAVHRHPAEPATTIASSTFSLPFKAGENDLLICCEQAIQGTAPWRLALQLPDLRSAPTARIQLPIGANYTKQLHAYEMLFDQATTDRDLFTGSDLVAIQWPQNLPEALPLNLRLQFPDGQIFAETLGLPRAGAQTRTLAAQRLPAGRYQAVLMPPPRGYAQGGLRLRRVLPLTVLSEPPQLARETPYLERLVGSLQQVMRRRQGLPAELAAMALGAWRYVNQTTVSAAVDSARRREANSVRTVLALLGMMERYERQPGFPATLRPLVENCLRTYDYAALDGGRSPVDNQKESETILRLATQIVAGQRYPAQAFGANRQTGSSLRRAAEIAARSWLLRRGWFGFQTMLDDDRLDDLIFALCQLHALAKENTVRELAAVLLDKLFFTVGLHTFQGIGPGGLLAPAAALGRVLWGEGVCNLHVWGLVGLADSGYELPGPLASVATEQSQDHWLHERQRDSDGVWQIERSVYRTPAFALSSVGDGTMLALRREHRRWQAALSPEAVVFVNHPAHLGEEPADLPNFWTGDASSPRLAHWRDTLLALYRLPADDWLGFTHAYFPLYAFDETLIRKNWFFARRGNGYIGLTASVPLTLISSGPGAHREIRAYGDEIAWLCQLGSADKEGSFDEFCTQLLTRPALLTVTAVDYTTPCGEKIEFGWSQPLRINGSLQEPRPARHYDSPYCQIGFPAEQIDIQVGDQVLQLDFSAGDESG